MDLTLDALEKLIRGSTGEELKQFVEAASAHKAVWTPQPGPQTDAYFSEADELLYGGAAGGGKSDLLVGLALTAHERSLLFRRQSVELAGLWERLVEVGKPVHSKSDDNKKRFRTTDGRYIEGGHLELPGSEKAWQGRPHDFIGFDEGAQLDEFKVAFVIQWIRSTTKGQRQRMVIATNPPIPSESDGVVVDAGSGDWLLRWFAPWIDETFPNPAQPGELRWCLMQRAGDRLTTIWVDGPGYYHPDTGERVEKPTQEQIDNGDVSAARSRTFIKSLLKDNAFLKGTGYAERLSSTPEPLKSMLLRGDFTVKGDDHPMQVIPTNWVLQAMERWETRQHEIAKLRQLVLAGDIAQGGADTTVLAPLYETDIFGPLKTQPGKATPTGKEVVAMLLGAHRDRSLIVLDATGGWAGSTTAYLDEHHDIDVEQFVASKTFGNWTPDNTYKYANLRAEMWWLFRLALNPESSFDIAIPNSPRLRAQLTTPHWFPRGKMLYVESKDDIRKRLSGASTDEADAVIMAWLYRDAALQQRARTELSLIDRVVHGKTQASAAQEAQRPFDLDDPLSDW